LVHLLVISKHRTKCTVRKIKEKINLTMFQSFTPLRHCRHGSYDLFSGNKNELKTTKFFLDPWIIEGGKDGLFRDFRNYQNTLR
jgi:hypothetical protein